MDPTRTGRPAAAYGPARGTRPDTSTTARQAPVGPLGTAGQTAAPTVAELAWAAGMFEGEGSVRISTRTTRNAGALLVDMVNVQPEVTAFFLERWGGIRKHVKVPPPRRDYWRWQLSARQAAAFLVQITPYLRTPVYRERADLAIEYQAQKSTDQRVNRTAGYAAEQDRYFLAMKRLNVRGREVLAPEVQP